MTRWVALHDSPETQALLEHYPNAYLLLTQIALRAKWKDCAVTGLKTGESWIGDWEKAGLHSKKAYEVAKARLVKSKLAAFRGSNRGTRATLLGSAVFSVTQNERGRPEEHQAGTKRESRGNPGGTNHTDTRIDGNTDTHQDGEEDQETKATGPFSLEIAAMPRGASRMGETGKKRARALRNTPLMIRMGSWFGKQPTTLWTIAELEALLHIAPEEPQIAGMENYYEAHIPQGDYRRKDLLTLLNNWNSELDRARGHALKNPQPE